MNCADCGKPLITHKIAVLPNGAYSLRKFAGTKRKRCPQCQKVFRRANMARLQREYRARNKESRK